MKPSHTLYFMRSQQRINCSFPCEPDSEGRVPRAEAGVAYFELDCHVPERQAVHQVRSVLCVKANRSSLDCGADDLSRYLLHLSLKSYPFFIQWEITHRALLTLLTGRLSVLWRHTTAIFCCSWPGKGTVGHCISYIGRSSLRLMCN